MKLAPRHGIGRHELRDQRPECWANDLLLNIKIFKMALAPTLERFCKSCGELASRHSVFHQVKPLRRGHMIDQTGLIFFHTWNPAEMRDKRSVEDDASRQMERNLLISPKALRCSYEMTISFLRDILSP